MRNIRRKEVFCTIYGDYDNLKGFGFVRADTHVQVNYDQSGRFPTTPWSDYIVKENVQIGDRQFLLEKRTFMLQPAHDTPRVMLKRNDVFVIAFDFCNRASFQTAINTFLPDLKRAQRIILLGLTDNISENNPAVITREEALDTVAEHNIDVFIECAYKNRPAWQGALKHIVLAALARRPRNHGNNGRLVYTDKQPSAENIQTFRDVHRAQEFVRETATLAVLGTTPQLENPLTQIPRDLLHYIGIFCAPGRGNPNPNNAVKLIFNNAGNNSHNTSVMVDGNERQILRSIFVHYQNKFGFDQQPEPDNRPSRGCTIS